MPAKKESRFKDIKDTASDAVEIIRELRTPEVQETLDKVKTLTDSAKGIMEELKTPEWVQNINNFQLITQNIDKTSARAETMLRELKDSGIMSGAASLAGGAGPGGSAGVKNDIGETIAAVRELLQSFKALADELRVAFADPRMVGTAQDVRQTAASVSSTIQTLKKYSGHT